jgi:small subunit ribosomal protein S9
MKDNKTVLEEDLHYQEESISDNENNLENLEENLEDKKEENLTVEAPEIGVGKYVESVGRRKSAVARVRIFDNNEKKSPNIIVNDRYYEDYFQKNIYLRKLADAPIRKLKIFDNYKIVVKAVGGGLRGQADAIRLAIARALIKINPEWKQKFRKTGLLTRDPREKERRKYGLKKARKSPQWHKR